MTTLQQATRSVRMAAAVAVLSLGAIGLSAYGPAGSAFAQAGTDQYKGQTLVVQRSTITGNADGFNAYYDAVANEFTARTGATVEYVSTAMHINEQMPLIMATRSGPDVIAASSMRAAYDSGAFLIFTDEDWEKMGGLDQFPPGQLGGSGPQGGPYASVPGYNQPYAMVYNKLLFEKAGIDHPPTTWTEYVEFAQKINDPENGVYGTGFDPADGANQDSWKTPFYFMNGYGGSLYAADGSPTIDSEASLAAYDFWFSWYTKFKIVDPNSLTWQNTQMYAAFADGKIGMLPAVNGSIGALARQGALGDNFAFAPLPIIPYGMDSLPEGGRPPSRLAQAGWYVGAYTENRDLALEFLKVTLMPEMLLIYFEQTGRFPVTTAGVELALASPEAQLFRPFLETITQFQQPVPYESWWNLAQTGLVAMGTQLAAKLATGEDVTTEDIKAALTEVQNSVSQ